MRYILTSLVTLFFSIGAAAQVSTLKINGDLMIHPSQVSEVFAIASDQVNKSSYWHWPELNFQQPYKTGWSNVQAHGPFALRINADGMNTQEVSFEFEWKDPSITVGQFSINDTIVRDIGGVQAVIHLVGGCSNMKWTAPGAQWKARGRVAWAVTNNQLQVQWRDFYFTIHSSTPAAAIDLGQCQGPPEIQDALMDSVRQATSNQSVMEDLLRRGILTFMNESLGNLRNELLKERMAVIGQNFELHWEPQFMISLPGGLLRIPGYVWLKKAGIQLLPAVVDRTLSEQEFPAVPESGFILPYTTMNAVAAFAHNAGDLRRRFKSTEIEGFTDLMYNWFAKIFVWPDLNNFSASDLFYFDLSSTGAPKLANPRNASDGGGVIYDAMGPALINMWAPAGSMYLNYVDFKGTVNGRFRTGVKSQQLVMGVSVDQLPLTYQYRFEYQVFRDVWNERIDATRLGRAATDFLNGKTFSVDLPKWDFGSNMSLIYGDPKMFKQGVLLPLSFQKK
jgi:hypothetical protein